jgi:hypothetical protein
MRSCNLADSEKASLAMERECWIEVAWDPEAPLSDRDEFLEAFLIRPPSNITGDSSISSLRLLFIAGN